ncbi:KH domain-containing protein [Persicirhabdus sediminis]|uniref:KH domain-containing protein n=1 Tax=Persicirhabdus sediminis TaxID=454144 RepID=A0A8J7SJP6_9BACT|nr:KH domain-containing protein [Persicirhabdus sediminis]MBK1791246.1 KH domain-containing protein [Persicirhabdus sediminis]
MEIATEQIRNFLQFVTLQFIDHPEHAQLRVAKIDESHVRFRLILAKEDVAILIGRNGFTASAIRNLLKATAAKHNISATLQIHSQEEEQQRMAAIEAGEIIDDEAK